MRFSFFFLIKKNGRKIEDPYSKGLQRWTLEVNPRMTVYRKGQNVHLKNGNIVRKVWIHAMFDVRGC